MTAPPLSAAVLAEAGAAPTASLAIVAEGQLSVAALEALILRDSTYAVIHRARGTGPVHDALATFKPAVLVVEDEDNHRMALRIHVEREGYKVLEARNPSEGLKTLENGNEVSMIFSDVRMPDPENGIEFIRTVRRRWPDLPLAAVTAYPDDLAGLHGTPDCPVLILAKPFHGQHIAEALSMALRKR